MKTVVVLFTRHKLTPSQLGELPTGERIDCSDLAGRNISSLEEGRAILEEVRNRLPALEEDDYKGRDVRIYGVIPVPIRALLAQKERAPYQEGGLSVWEAFNVNRAKEGEKPTFEHVCWLCTGQY